MRGHRVIAAVACTIGLVGVFPVTASATVVDRSRFSFTDSSTFNDCGFDLYSDFSVSVHQVIRSFDGEAFLGSANIETHEVLTNPATGGWFTIDSHELSKEVKVEHLDGTVYAFTLHEVGAPFTVTDSSGQVVIRDRGLIESITVQDTLGDGVPSSNLLSFETVRVAGPHPGLDLDFCAMAAELTGA